MNTLFQKTALLFNMSGGDPIVRELLESLPVNELGVLHKNPDLLEAVIQPCLLDRKGWLVVIGTAYGRLNQFYDLYEKSEDLESALGVMQSIIQLTPSNPEPREKLVDLYERRGDFGLAQSRADHGHENFGLTA